MGVVQLGVVQLGVVQLGVVQMGVDRERSPLLLLNARATAALRGFPFRGSERHEKFPLWDNFVFFF